MVKAPAKKVYGVRLPSSKEPRLVYIGRGMLGRLLYMQDVETGVKACGFNPMECLKSLEGLINSGNNSAPCAPESAST